MHLPSLFVSHGAPDLVLSEIPARDHLQRLSMSLPRPKLVLVVSAHWFHRDLCITASAKPETIHDFHGFPQALYDIEYPAPGSPLWAKKLLDHLTEKGVAASLDWERGLDHGAWVPLQLMYPEADVAAIQLSIPTKASPGDLYALGQVLAPLREEGVLVLGSGGIVHNLRALNEEGTPPENWASGFSDWLTRCVETARVEAALDFAQQAPQPELAHPLDDHLRPLFVAWGAGGRKGQTLHRSFSYGNLAMDCYAF